MKINVIDLFAGPGGLGEGFSAFRDRAGQRPFAIRMSVEKEASAHRTLELRAFTRKFSDYGLPEDYHLYRKGEISREDLFGKWPDAAREAAEETLGGPTILGEDNDFVHERICQLQKLHGTDGWVVIGGPPCQAYSIVGRARNRGKKDYRPEKDARNFLYQEYLEVLARVRPEVFVMENVRGMLSARINGCPIFPTIIEDLRRPGEATEYPGTGDLEYRIHSLAVPSPLDWIGHSPRDFIIRAEEHGIPQRRHRVILLGIRKDIRKQPPLLTHREPVTSGDVLALLPRLRSRISRGEDSSAHWCSILKKGVDRLCSVLRHDQNAELVLRLEQVVHELDPCLPTEFGRHEEMQNTRNSGEMSDLHEWLTQDNRGILTGHVSRSHMPSDLVRYLFAACWADVHDGASPKAPDYPKLLAPEHVNWETGDFVDRFKVQAANLPATTVTSHISKDGHYFIHPDPLQCRSLTVREAARLQTFPDNYHFEGTRTQQYVQVGNAVPPFLARQIAEIVHEILS